MRKSGGAVILMNEDKIAWFVGNKVPEYYVCPPYSNTVCSFLADLSSYLLKDKIALQYPDIVSFAYFCRKANIQKKKENFQIENQYRLGRGIIFHIAPSNVPVNFAFSFVFGLIAGNGNIVRVPSKKFPHTEIICKAISTVLGKAEYENIKKSNVFLQYGHEDEITEYLSSISQGRFIWGGDAAITYIRKFSLPPRGVDITFSDRYSFAVLNRDTVHTCSDVELQKLVSAFYNDTYLMDQNACSSPQLVIWVGKQILEAKNRFWTAVAEFAEKKYRLQAVSAVDKFTKLCSEAIENKNLGSVTRYDNILYVTDVEKLPENVDTLRGTCGYFYQYSIDSLDEIASFVNEKYQTVVYFGVSSKELSDFVINNNLKGIDRIVPVGQALDIDVIWDGYDLVRTLSRIVDVR